MHLRHADGDVGDAEAAAQPARHLVRERLGRHDRWRFRSDVRTGAAAALAAESARLRLFAALSLPRPTRRHAHASDRHGAVRVRRSEEHTSELQSLMRLSYAALFLTKNN